jgi:hypothetical protein
MKPNDFPIIERLGGIERTYELLKAAGYGAETIDSIRMWRARRSMPGSAIVLLMRICEAQAIDYSAADFVCTPMASEAA